VGLVYANCFNMWIRGTSCLYYAVEMHNTEKQQAQPVIKVQERSFLSYILSLFTGKIFIGLALLGCLACLVLQYAMNYYLQRKQ